MAKTTQSNGNRGPSFAVVCIPRIDYSAIFSAYGALCASTVEYNSLSRSNARNPDGLIGKTVSYKRSSGKLYIGILETVDNASGIATILTKSGALVRSRIQIARNDWPSLKETSVAFRLAKGATERQLDRAGKTYTEFHQIEMVMGPEIARAATGTLRPYATIVGEKTRFIEELTSLKFTNGRSSIPAAMVLNSENESGKRSRNGGPWLNLIASGRELPDVETELVIFEASRRLGDHLQQLSASQRAIVLVAANKRAYNDIVELIAPVINSRGISIPTHDFGAVPHYMKVIFIQ